MTKIQTGSRERKEELLARVKKYFPELTVNSCELLTEGWDHEVLILDKSIVFRFPDDEEYAALLPKEIEILRRLQPLVPIAIPNYTFIPPDVSFAGYKIISGKTLTKKYFDQLSKDQRADIAHQLADFLTVLHTAIKNGHDFSSLKDSYMNNDQKEVKELAAKYLGSVLTESEVNTVKEILQDVDELLEKPAESVFIHGDIYNRHLLWDEQTGKLGVIDFSDMYRGDPAIDFAEIHEYGKDFVEDVYDYYAGPKDPSFLERAWKYQKWAAVFMLTDYFVYHKTSFEEARETFDRVLSQQYRYQNG